MDLSKLECTLGHKFGQQRLLIQALTHSSLAHEYANRNSGVEPGPDLSDNEQMEFLGDAVVGLVAAEWLYLKFPDLSEGELTRLRAALVSRQHLGKVAQVLEIGSYLRLGRGEERSGGRKKGALLANCIEAIIAALYLDGGLPPASRFVESYVIAPYIDGLRSQMKHASTIGDYKSALQEYLQAQKIGQPEYIVKAESGPDHRKRFLVAVQTSTEGTATMLARGIGVTKKKAEQEAARRAYDKLRRSHRKEVAL
ncbi:ribonuclease III [Acidipila rosea]|uniref:Ribonuclease 3 n=1 Tax=Acidipila rosea TaxID=768535 RepID=A0A4V2PUV5_9BACT|nr:ribonuclease III [Acidipila rosea]MBW4028114.1 ribonuclease III [Acidobacteriota bacterium]MBW4046103.1 ribonuclease III [Acidobacteriota bacterium]TCK71951.1 RNAse III [Acidipila rosea]